MMLVYHPYWLDALRISREAKRLLTRKWITPEQYKIISAAFITPLYTPKLFERVALLVFTSACVAGAFLFATRLFDDDVNSYYVSSLTIGVLCVAALELLIRFKKAYQAGVDDALLYGGLIFIIGGMLNLANSVYGLPVSLQCAIALPFLIFAATRYVDRLCAAAALLDVLSILFLLQEQHRSIGRIFLSFDMMVLSAVACFSCRQLKNNKRLVPWTNCLNALEITSLCTFYLMGNSYVAQTFIDPEFRLASISGEALKVESAYYLFTFILPISYIVLGLANRDRLLLRVGLLVEGASLLTLRYYFHAIALEHALIVLGFSLILMTAVAIQTLKTAKKGFTHEKTPPQLPEYVAPKALILYDRLTTQREAVKAFEAGDGNLDNRKAPIGW